MTDIRKTIAFAKECLKWGDPKVCRDHDLLTVTDSQNPLKVLNPPDFYVYLDDFLGNRFFIQINRGSASLFKWSVIVGRQNLLGASAVFDHGHGEGDDMVDAILDACVAAVRLYPPA